MKPELKSLYSLELEDSLINYEPKDALNFSTWVRAYIGPRGQAGAEAFDIQVCTSAWLESQCSVQGHMWGRHMLIVDTYNHDAVKKIVEQYIAEIDEADWNAIAEKLSRIGAWEFEDYQDR